MEVDFSDKVVLVTGASAGIGESTALLFAQYGAKLALVGTKEANLRDVAERCQQYKGIKPLAIVADLSTDEGCEKTAKATLDHYGRVDVLVNNAGVGAAGTIQTTEMASYDRVFNLNVRGVYNLTRLLVPTLIESKGNIINISSIASTVVAVGLLPYHMTKAALDHFTRLVALELAPKGVRVNSINPGVTVSKIMHRMNNLSDADYEKFLRSAEQVIPMGAVCTGDDVARMVLFVASDLSRLVTGTIIPVDGGLQYGSSDGLVQK